jgi:hypothetical protein
MLMRSVVVVMAVEEVEEGECEREGLDRCE